MDTSSEKPLKISRRDFLGLTGTALSATLLRFPGGAKETNPNKPYQFETDMAIYCPLYEVHNKRTPMEKIKTTNPDLLFEESSNYSIYLVSAVPLSLLKAKNLTKNPETGEEITQRVLADETLEYLSQKKASVSFEGVAIPEDIAQILRMSKSGLSISSSMLYLNELSRVFRKRFLKQPVNIPDKTRVAIAALLTLWSNSDNLTEGGLYEICTHLDQNQYEEVKLIAARINGFVSQAHPEKPVVFIRNILMARKLILLGENEFRNKNEKPRITFQVGAGHAGIEDLLSTGSASGEITLAMLDIYPKEFLKYIVEHNGGQDKDITEQIQNFCSTVVIPVKPNLEGQEVKYLVIDNELKAYLEERLLGEKKDAVS